MLRRLKMHSFSVSSLRSGNNIFKPCSRKWRFSESIVSNSWATTGEMSWHSENANRKSLECSCRQYSKIKIDLRYPLKPCPLAPQYCQSIKIIARSGTTSLIKVCQCPRLESAKYFARCSKYTAFWRSLIGVSGAKRWKTTQNVAREQMPLDFMLRVRIALISDLWHFMEFWGISPSFLLHNRQSFSLAPSMLARA